MTKEEMIRFCEMLYSARTILLTKINKQPDEHGKIKLFTQGSAGASLIFNQDDSLEFHSNRSNFIKDSVLNIKFFPREITIRITNRESVTDLTEESSVTLLSIKNGTIESTETKTYTNYSDSSQDWNHTAKIPVDEEFSLMQGVVQQLIKEIPNVQEAITEYSEYSSKVDNEVHRFFQEVNTDLRSKKDTPSVDKGVEEIIKGYIR
jgi:hypothetical protein